MSVSNPTHRQPPASTTGSAGQPAAHNQIDPPNQIDPRGQRWSATITTVVLALVLLSAGSPFGLVLLAAQALVFAIGAIAGPRSSPYAQLFAWLVRPRIGPPAELESAEPPRFAQAVGLVFAVVALAGYLLGIPLVGTVAVAFALGAAFLNAAFGFCLGCELYLLARRVLAAVTSRSSISAT